ncbi:MAG TPA: hypothetical protein VFQ65_23370 [Kofleriaceae bacterium]|nr:hypothetical protein [Kofleriaceae bacterium]
MKRSLLALALVGCGGLDANNSHTTLTDAPTSGDAGGCENTLIFDPPFPVAGDHIKVTAQVFTSGVLDYAWLVDGVANTNYETADPAHDHSAIGFDAPTATSHTVSVTITGNTGGCNYAEQTINVGNPTGTIVMYRIRVTPPAALAPPQETLIQVHGGQSIDRPFSIDPGAVLNGTVTAGAPVAAYVKLTPVLGPAFDVVTTGAFTTHLALQAHTVLVIPEDNALAPRMFTWMPGMGPSTFPVDGGSPVGGTVVDRGGSPLANAQVQLEQLGVPSTIATTAANGSFTTHATFDSTDPIIVTITPPATSGLPRLTATAVFDLTKSVQVSYAASPASCNLAGTPVTRATAPQPNAVVTVVGALAGTTGTVTTGTISANASGSVHIAATTNGSGALPATLVPRAPLAAVIEVAAGDFAVAPLDTSTCAAQALDAPANITTSGALDSSANATIAGARGEATPIGTLALANLLPVESTTDGNGMFSFRLAAGAHYALHFFDPGGRGAPHDYPDETAVGVPQSVTLAKALAITGQVTVIGFPNPVANASIQILCASCTGVAASQPIAETATDTTGAYRIAVPDPM